MIINKGKPWIVWPKKYSHGLCRKDINDSLQGKNDFTLGITFKLLNGGPEKRTIFSRLPNYLGLDIEKEDQNASGYCKESLKLLTRSMIQEEAVAKPKRRRKRNKVFAQKDDVPEDEEL